MQKASLPRNGGVYEFISKQSNDPIMERRTCAVSSKPFAIFQSDKDFLKKISPTFPLSEGEGSGVRKYPLPLPTLCPEERQRRRLSRRNERKLYRRKCDATGKQIISMYSPDKPYKVYNQDARFSDSWDAKDYGMEIDFSKSMREQFSQLLLAVPKRGLSMGRGSENCDYVNGVGMSKNCYLIFGASFDEECYYGSGINNCKHCVDNTGIKDSEILYGCSDCTNCYKSFYLQDCLNCKDSSYLINCKNCDRCYGCVNLENQHYHIFNTPYHDKEAYEQALLTISPDVRVQEMKKLIKKYPVQNCTCINVEGGIGDKIFNSKDIFYGFDIKNAEHIKYANGTSNSRDCMDVSGVDGYVTDGCTKIYEAGYIFEQSFDVAFSSICRNNCHNIYYCIECCRKVENCFLCCGLKGGSYCILNKQYTPEEYNALVPQIIKKMQADSERGENFPISMSTFAYNESVVQERLPLTREEALARGYKRQDNNYDPTISSGTTTLMGDQIPSDITAVTDNILNAILICEVSKRPFRIIKQELDFYRKYNLPLPRKHPDVRHLERLTQRPGRELHLRACDKCGVEMLSIYPPHFDRKVYCESCYNKEMYG